MKYSCDGNAQSSDRLWCMLLSNGMLEFTKDQTCVSIVHKLNLKRNMQLSPSNPAQIESNLWVLQSINHEYAFECSPLEVGHWVQSIQKTFCFLFIFL